MTAWRFFPVPEFREKELKNMAGQPPAYLSAGDVEKLVRDRKAGKTARLGAYPIQPTEEFFAPLKVRGEHRHALLCLLPDQEVHVLGRSYAWPIQGAWLLDSLEPGSAKIVADWKTTRPMNTRLGPTEGIAYKGDVLVLVCGHAYGDHWIGNRTIVQNDWQDAEAGERGFRVLASAKAESKDFHDCVVTFRWPA